MAELAEYDEVEPDMEHDPTLASCCRREIKDRRIKQSKLDHIRSGMPAAVRPCTVLLYCPRARPSSQLELRAVHAAPLIFHSSLTAGGQVAHHVMLQLAFVHLRTRCRVPTPDREHLPSHVLRAGTDW